MTSRMTKLAAAALIIVAVVLGARYFDGTPVKAVEFSEITRAMEQIPWMRMTESGFQDGEALACETWFGFDAKIHAVKEAGGYTRFESLKDHLLFDYAVQSGTIVVTYMEEAAAELTSPTTWLESVHKTLGEQGAKTTVRMGDYQGHRVQIQELSLTEQGERKKVVLYVDPQTKRLHAGKATCADATGELTTEVNLDFDYPATGPQSIYDLDVPRDAKVVTNPPAAESRSLLEEWRQVLGETSREYSVLQKYLQTRDEATTEYIAVVAHNTAVDISDALNMLDVDYRSGRKHRWERHSVFDEGQTFRDPQDPAWTISKQRLGETFESMLAWSRGQYAEHAKTRMSIHLYDGQYGRSISRDPGKGWSKPMNYYQPAGEFGITNDLANLGWPHIDVRARIIEDGYAAEHKLICFERLAQGHIYNGTVTLPGRFLYYLDPAWDYLCRRQVTEWRPDAEWQEDQGWLNDVDPTKTRDGSIIVEEITEAFQAPNGHWYPRFVIERQTGIRKDYRHVPVKDNRSKRIYLDLTPKFPDGIFDIDRLPGQ